MTACVITFPEGLPGFEGCRRFTLVPHPGPQGHGRQPVRVAAIGRGRRAGLPDDGTRAWPSPSTTRTCPPPNWKRWHWSGSTAKARCLYAVLTVPKGDPAGITANLMAPLVVNEYARLGKQIVAAGDDYGLRHRLLPN